MGKLLTCNRKAFAKLFFLNRLRADSVFCFCMSVIGSKFMVGPGSDYSCVRLLSIDQRGVTSVRIRYADLRDVFGFANASDAELRVFLMREENKEAVAEIANRLDEAGETKFVSPGYVIEIPRKALEQAKDRFLMDGVEVRPVFAQLR